MANDSIVSARRMLREARVEERMRRESAGETRPPRLPEPAVFLRDGQLVVRFTAPAPAPFPAADLAPLAVETIATLEKCATPMKSAGAQHEAASGHDAKREYSVQAHCSDVAYQLLVTPKGAGKRGWIGRGGGDARDDSALSALFVAPKVGGAPSEVEFSKRGSLTPTDANAIVSAVSGGWLRAGMNAGMQCECAGRRGGQCGRGTRVGGRGQAGHRSRRDGREGVPQRPRRDGRWYHHGFIRVGVADGIRGTEEGD